MVYKDKLKIYQGVICPLVDVLNETSKRYKIKDADKLAEKIPEVAPLQYALVTAMELAECHLDKDGSSIKPPKNPKQKASKKKR